MPAEIWRPIPTTQITQQDMEYREILNYGWTGRGGQTGETEGGGKQPDEKPRESDDWLEKAMDVWDALQDIPTQYMKWMSRALGGSACTDKFIGDRRRRNSAKLKNQGSNGR